MGDSKRDFYDWVKLALDNKTIIISIISFLISAGVNVSQAVDIQEKNKDLKAVGESYAAIVYQNMDIKPKESAKPAEKTIYINHCANECMAIVKKLIADYDKAHREEFH